MKIKTIYLIFSFCFLVLNVLADEEKVSLSEMITTLQNIGENCPVKPSNATIIAILKHKEDADRDTKCFRHCLLEIFDVLEPDSSQIREETALELAGMLYPDRKPEMEEIIKICNKKIEKVQDKCDGAHEHFVCSMEQMKARGFEIKGFKED